MTLASPLYRHRRVLLLVAASLLLHVLTIDWVGDHIGPLQQHAAPRAPATIVAQLHQAPPVSLPQVVPPVPPPSAPAPAPRPRPPRVVPRPPPPEPVAEPVAATPPPAPAEQAPAPPPVPDAAPAPQAQAAAKPVVASDAASAPDTPGPAPVVAPPPSAPHRYKVDLPPSGEIGLAVNRVDADGTEWHGAAAMIWRQDGAGYTLSVEAGLNLLITRINLIVISSVGDIDDAGIAPVRMSEKRRGRAETATHFNRVDGTVSFSGSERSVALLPGTQDQATVPFQLAAIGRADARQFGDQFDMLVGEDREVSLYHFIVAGQEELDTKLGKLTTWHLSRPPRPGSYSSAIDIWLAPSRYWFPVQIRNTEANGAVTTQSVTQIVIANPGK